MANSKLKNKKTTRQVGKEVYSFDSLKEARRFDELYLMAQKGLIQDLSLQPEFQIIEPVKYKDWRRMQARLYIADFKYTQSGVTIVEDVKSEFTRKLPVYTLKRQLFLLQYGGTVDFREV